MSLRGGRRADVAIFCSMGIELYQVYIITNRNEFEDCFAALAMTDFESLASQEVDAR
jgi:hypothetical protein